MTMDKELKESLNLSFEYLRAYGEAELLDAVKGWRRVYVDNKPEERESEDVSVEEETSVKLETVDKMLFGFATLGGTLFAVMFHWVAHFELASSMAIGLAGFFAILVYVHIFA